MARLKVRNYRGREVPAVLGFALLSGGIGAALSVAILDRVGTAGLVAGGAASLVFAAGLADDLLPGGPRGLREHLAALVHGRVSTGAVKLLVMVASSVVTVAAGPQRDAPTRMAGVVLIAAAANLWNGLDVRPGRAIKFGLLALPAVAAMSWPAAPFVPGVWLASLLVLPWDAGERAMLGDSGANLLGFSLGLACYYSLSGRQLLVAAGLAAALNVAADTVTLSRVIDVVPPLRWWDRLGRKP
ncbi:MAG: hypothetical protein HY240_03295 [Actinobacteria bacterium]|nr:hypothetical protein [Actinomycetota bacterium]